MYPRLQIQKRALLIASISFTTLACLLGGAAVYSRWLETEIHALVKRQVILDNRQTAKQLTRLVREMDIPDEMRLVAAGRLDGLSADLMVHQRESGVQQSVAQIMTPVRALGIAIAGAVTLLVTIFSRKVIFEGRGGHLDSQAVEALLSVERQLESLTKESQEAHATVAAAEQLTEELQSLSGGHALPYAVIPGTRPEFIFHDMGCAVSPGSLAGSRTPIYDTSHSR